MQKCLKTVYKAAACSHPPAEACNTSHEPRAASDHSRSHALIVAIKWLINLFLSVTVCRLECDIPSLSLKSLHIWKQLHKQRKTPAILSICCEKEIIFQRHRTSEKMIFDLFGSIWPWSEIAPYSTDKKTLRRLPQSFCAFGVSWHWMIFRNTGSCFMGRSEPVNWNDITITNISEWK